MVLVNVGRLLELLSQPGPLTTAAAVLNFVPPFDLQALFDFLKLMPDDMVTPLVENMQGWIFRATMGSGSMLVCPPGWAIAEQTMLTNCMGFRLVFATANNKAIDDINGLRAKKSAVIEVVKKLVSTREL